MNHSLSLLLIIVCALTSTIDRVQAKKGCSAFGHSCYGGHGKRSLREQEEREQKQQGQLEQMQPNEIFEVFPNVAESNRRRIENSRIMKILNQMVPVTVYYESLCPDSAAFVNDQIHPALKDDLKEYVDITWVPFGKSTFTTQASDVEFTCHHGPNECYGNKVHACAIEHTQANSYQTEFTRESLILDFISCLMKAGKNFPDNVYPGARCARENNIHVWENIQNCANSTEGSMLLKKYGEMTNQFMSPLKSVPTVVFHQQYDAEVQDKALKNFRQALCKNIPQPQPMGCAAQSSAVSIAAIPLLGGLLYGILRLFI